MLCHIREPRMERSQDCMSQKAKNLNAELSKCEQEILNSDMLPIMERSLLSLLAYTVAFRCITCIIKTWKGLPWAHQWFSDLWALCVVERSWWPHWISWWSSRGWFHCTTFNHTTWRWKKTISSNAGRNALIRKSPCQLKMSESTTATKTLSQYTQGKHSTARPPT